jgi:carboxyl-terminal processing protease
MDSKPLYTLVGVLVAVVLLVGACSAGFLGGMTLAPAWQEVSSTPVAPVLNPDSGSTGQPQDTGELFTPFWEAWQMVHDYYVDQPVDDTTLMQGAIRGMLESLGDQHSSYMDPQEFEDANAPLQGYEGIGAFVNTEGEYLTIVDPISGSPAEAAGLVRGDQVIAIDGVDMTGTLPENARLKVLVGRHHRHLDHPARGGGRAVRCAHYPRQDHHPER